MERRNVLKSVGLVAAGTTVSPVAMGAPAQPVGPLVVLPDADRARLWRGMMRFLSHEAETFPYEGMLKADGRAAVDAVDAWVNSVQAAYNTALPEPFKTQAGLDMKALFLCANTAYRVSPAFARKLFGGMD